MDATSYEQSIRDREKAITKTSFVGVLVNLLLAGMKAFVGLFSHSIAIVLDAVNNLSDALSSVITIVGAKLGAKAPTKKHPLGYGRIEYLSSTIVAAIVVYAGITSLVESIKKIVHPEAAEYQLTSLIILAVAVLVKILLGLFVKKQGKKHNSGALVASGTEAMMDAILSTAVLLSAVIYMIWGISVEAYVSVVISGFIIKTGIEMMMDTLNDILGKRSDREEINRIKKLICEEEEVYGAYDLTLYNYGPNKNYASVHIELPDTMTVKEVDTLSRRIQERVLLETGVVLMGISVYSHNTKDDEATRIRNEIQRLVLTHEWALQMHGFYLDHIHKEIRFDLVLSFSIQRDKAMEIVYREIQELYPDFQLFIVSDIDV